MFSSLKLTKSSPARDRSREIDRQLIEDYRKNQEYHNILLLGTGEAGKTTILKQMKLIHLNAYTDQERRDKVQDIRANVHESIYNLVKNANTAQISDENSSKLAKEILDIGPTPPQAYSEEYFDAVNVLWRNPVIQQVFARGHEYNLLDSTEEYMNRLQEIRRSDYVPSTQDILYCRVRTTTITNIRFEVKVGKKYGGGSAKFSMIDVGGQRVYRKKWISVFENVETILFLISIAEFDQVLREDSTTNRLKESLTLFQNMYSSRYLQPTNAIIFLNKEDILHRKITNGRSIGAYFDDYETFQHCSDQVQNTKMFIKAQVQSIIDSSSAQKRGVYIHFTVATSTQNIKHIFDSVHQIIIERALEDLVPL